MLAFLGPLCHQFVMKSPRLRGKLMPRGCVRLGGRPKAWPWKTWSRPSSWWKRSNSKRISREPQSSNNSWLVNNRINRNQRFPQLRPHQLPCRPCPFSSHLAVRFACISYLAAFSIASEACKAELSWGYWPLPPRQCSLFSFITLDCKRARDSSKEKLCFLNLPLSIGYRDRLFKADLNILKS